MILPGALEPEGPREDGIYGTNEIKRSTLKGESLDGYSNWGFILLYFSFASFFPSVLLTRRVKIGFY